MMLALTLSARNKLVWHAGSRNACSSRDVDAEGVYLGSFRYMAVSSRAVSRDAAGYSFALLLKFMHVLLSSLQRPHCGTRRSITWTSLRCCVAAESRLFQKVCPTLLQFSTGTAAVLTGTNPPRRRSCRAPQCRAFCCQGPPKRGRAGRHRAQEPRTLTGEQELGGRSAQTAIGSAMGAVAGLGRPRLLPTSMVPTPSSVSSSISSEWFCGMTQHECISHRKTSQRALCLRNNLHFCCGECALQPASACGGKVHASHTTAKSRCNSSHRLKTHGCAHAQTAVLTAKMFLTNTATAHANQRNAVRAPDGRR